MTNKSNTKKDKKSKSKRGGNVSRSAPWTGPCNTVTLAQPKRVVRLGYQGKFVTTEASAGSGAVAQYRLNSLYDPDAFGTGSQPLWFDQLAAMYGQFRVLRAHVHLETYNAESAPAQLGVYASSTLTSPSDPLSWGVQPFAKYVNAGNANAATAKFVFDAVINIAQVLGVKETEFHNDMDYVCTNAGNPLRQAYIIPYVIGLRTTATTMVGTIAIQYEVECSLPLSLNLS